MVYLPALFSALAHSREQAPDGEVKYREKIKNFR